MPTLEKQIKTLLMSFDKEDVIDFAFAAKANHKKSDSKSKIADSIVEEIQYDEMRGYIKYLKEELGDQKPSKKAKSPSKKAKSPSKKAKSPSKKTCKASEIRNPATGRCVSKKGKIGQSLSSKKSPSKKSPSKKSPSKKSPSKKSLCPGKITRGGSVLTLRDKESTSSKCVYTRKTK